MFGRALVAIAIACGSAMPAAARADVAVRDDYGNEVRLSRPAQRIASLSPHLTELLFAAGAGARVVATVEYSDHPPAAREVPRVGNDASIDLERLLTLRPDLVVAWPNAGSLKAIDRIAAMGLPVFRSEPRDFEQIATTLERLGMLAGTAEAARTEAAAFRARAAALAARHAGRSPVRVFYQVWGRPIITVNGEHLISKAISLCGGRNVFASLPGIAPEVDREAVLRSDPELIVASGTADERPAWLDEWNSFRRLAAVARGQLRVIPPQLIQRHTPRVLEGTERLCRMLDEARAAR